MKVSDELFKYFEGLPEQSIQLGLFAVGRTNGPTDKLIGDSVTPEGFKVKYDANARIEISKEDLIKITFTFKPQKDRNMAKVVYKGQSTVIMQKDWDLWTLGLSAFLGDLDRIDKWVLDYINKINL